MQDIILLVPVQIILQIILQILANMNDQFFSHWRHWRSPTVKQRYDTPAHRQWRQRVFALDRLDHHWRYTANTYYMYVFISIIAPMAVHRHWRCISNCTGDRHCSDFHPHRQWRHWLAAFGDAIGANSSRQRSPLAAIAPLAAPMRKNTGRSYSPKFLGHTCHVIKSHVIVARGFSQS